jgi:FHA domain-containing protein
MFPAWRLKVREARLALDEGRWDEAARLLRRESVREFLPAKKLSRQLADQLIERASTRMAGANSAAGWNDLQLAANLGGCSEQIARLHEQQTQQTHDKVRNLLEQGETRLALDELERFQQRQLDNSDSRAWKQVAQWLGRADKRAAGGDLKEAASALHQATLLIPGEKKTQLAKRLHLREKQMRIEAKRLQRLSAQMHLYLARATWTKVLAIAEAMLELAPAHRAARAARRQAWRAVGMDVTHTHHPRGRSAGLQPNKPVVLCYPNHGADQASAVSTHRPESEANVDTKSKGRKRGKRLIAWIDRVGGYLICLDDEVILGQPASSSAVDIPILGDLARRHATIQRDGESYVLTPIHRVSVDGERLAGPALLSDGCLLEFGETVRMRFRKPHALSATAVLTLESHHKTEPAVDAILLMADSCILGPKKHSHICCRGWPDDLVLMHREGELIARTQMPLEIDGRPCDSRSPIADNCRLENDEIALSFESL